ncbi:MAG: hypothetical protein NC453_12320 [Muribaculum sp.]|nr:hypothetical protein [Muribaculum sp.]
MNEQRNKYSLFQAENGKWGTKNANGDVYDHPEYERCVKDDGSVVFYNGIDTICSFSEDEGMELIVYCEPWWYVVFSLARFPKEYNSYLEKHLRKPEDCYPQIVLSIGAISRQLQPSEIQQHILNGIQQFIECELKYRDDPFDDSDETVYKEWIANSPAELSNPECVDAILPIMQSSKVLEIDKEHLWFGLFRFIDFITAMKPQK